MSVAETALKYVGKTEKPGNMGFTDADFEKRMLAVGFVKSHAWCCYFAELVFKEALPEKFAELDKLFSASCVQTFNNFSTANYKISLIPTVGTLAIWQSVRDGRPLITGHAGIVVTAISPTQFSSVEGNTTEGGSREGFIVGENFHTVRTNVLTGKKLLGFITL